MEIKKEVKTYLIDYECPVCKKGLLRSNGVCLTSNPPQYPHKCNNKECNYMETFTDKKYPYKIYE
jgi:hypothetical protein